MLQTGALLYESAKKNKDLLAVVCVEIDNFDVFVESKGHEVGDEAIKHLGRILEKQFNYSFPGDYAYLISEKNKIYIVSKDISKLDLNKLRIDRYGLYLGEMKDGSLRLSMEASQLLFQEAKKNGQKLTNLIELNEK